ncbi:hypothetical protein GFM18_27100 [Rhizobium laguerreae]|nr:hypothetical protein [Rhizobium laguerreae]
MQSAVAQARWRFVELAKLLAGRLELNTMRRYLVVIGVAGECSTRAFATAEVACLLLTTDVLALV